ncbi:MAG: hypothetical protein JWO40_688 [Candidatus Doudnabacteria bacterium]|nr:hypothetical protein [Candidatus Doudnabacteria bacterium]
MHFPNILFLLCGALSFYGIGLIWSMELITLRSWMVVDDTELFHKVRGVHWRVLPYLVFIPTGILVLCSTILLWVHPAKILFPLLLLAVLIQYMILVLTGSMWGRWERKISAEHQSSTSPLMKRLRETHWIRTALITLNGLIFFLLLISTYS